MQIPKLECVISIDCRINYTEDPQKVRHAISNIFLDVDIVTNRHSVHATSKKLDSLVKIYDAIHIHKTQKTYFRILHSNLLDYSTWFYLNKQAAFVNYVALCDNSDESPLGPIKARIESINIEQIVRWLIS